MATTQYIPHKTSNGTFNINRLLLPHQLQAIRLIVPRDMEKVFGPGIKDVYDPERGFKGPEWYFQSSDGIIFGIGWRWDYPRLRCQGSPNQSQINDFFSFLIRELDNASALT